MRGVDRGFPCPLRLRPTPPARICNSLVAASPVERRREASISFRRATVNSHASGFDGQPLSGQSASAEANASDSASSAAATSRVRAARKATSLP